MSESRRTIGARNVLPSAPRESSSCEYAYLITDGNVLPSVSDSLHNISLCILFWGIIRSRTMCVIFLILILWKIRSHITIQKLDDFSKFLKTYPQKISSNLHTMYVDCFGLHVFWRFLERGHDLVRLKWNALKHLKNVPTLT